MENTNLLISLDFKGEELALYVPEPSFDRVKSCIALFQFIFRNSTSLPPAILAKDLPLIIDEISKEKNLPDLKLHFEGLIQECVLRMKALNPSPDKDKPLLEGLELFNALDDDDKDTFKAMLVFSYALLRYVPQKLRTKELQEFYTALNFEDQQKLFLKSLEDKQKKSLRQNKQKG